MDVATTSIVVVWLLGIFFWGAFTYGVTKLAGRAERQAREAELPADTAPEGLAAKELPVHR